MRKWIRRGGAVVVAMVLVAAGVWAIAAAIGGSSSKGSKESEAKELLERHSESGGREEGEEEGKEREDEPGKLHELEALRRSPDVAWSRGKEPVAAPIATQSLVAADASATTASARSAGAAKPPDNDFGGPALQIGPDNIGGRTRKIVIHPTSPNTMWAAAVAGGVWKTTDAGSTWAPLDDLMANLAVSSLVLDPTNPLVLYAGTGEGVFNGDAVRGAGIFKTTDGGTTWSQLAATATSASFQYVNDLVVSSGNAQRVYAATRSGILRSLDGGATWTLVHDPGVTGGCLDLAIRTDTGATDTVFASCGTFDSSTIYRNTDAGGAGPWSAVYGAAAAAPVSDMGRVSLAIAPSNQNVVYALAANVDEGRFKRLVRTTTGGAAGTWSVRTDDTSSNPLNPTLLSNPPYALGCFGDPEFFDQGWYDNIIAVDPASSDKVWVGGIDLFRSDDGGTSFGQASEWYFDPSDDDYAHADQHAIAFAPGYNGTTNQTMFVGNDGGIQRTLNARAATATTKTQVCDGDGSANQVAWATRNHGYAVTQFYDGAVYPNGATYFAGAQDNGTLRGSTAGGLTWDEIAGGDGGYVAVDPTNTNTLFGEFTGLSIQRSTDGGANFTDAVNGIDESPDDFLFINPFHMAAANPDVLFTGGFVIWRTTDQAETWVQASGTTPGEGSVSALTTHPLNANKALVGMSDGWILRSSSALTTTSSTTWASVQPRDGFVSELTFDPVDPNVAYATYSTFGGTHVWKTIDAGGSWSPLDGTAGNTIPDVPVSSLVVNPDNTAHLYAGTDIGVFVSLDGGASWTREHGGIPNVAINRLKILRVAGHLHLFAFTHGRSTFRVPLETTGVASVVPADFDGDGKTDRSVFRPSNSKWYIDAPPSSVAFGATGDIPVPAGYDADPQADRAVFRPSSGRWYVEGTAGSVAYGAPGDIPVPGYYDADPELDRAVYRPSTGRWYVEGTAGSVAFGAPGDIPVPGNYDGDAQTDIAVYRPSSGRWYVEGTPGSVAFGTPGDVPVPGTYDADPQTDRAVFRPSSGRWYVEGAATVAFGTSGDIPVPGNYDADVATDRAVFRPSSGRWYVEGTPGSVALGSSSDVPLPLPPAIYRAFFP